MSCKHVLLAGATFSFALVSTAHAASNVSNAGGTSAEKVAAAVAYPGRPPNDRDRDAARKPAETLALSGVKAGDEVADFMPGDGYYTRIFSHIVGPKGRVYPVVPVIGGLMAERRAQTEQIKTGKIPDPLPIDVIHAVQDIYEYSGNVTALWVQLTQYGGQFPLPEQVNVVWTAGDYHELHAPKFQQMDVAAVDKAIFRALKPGGVYVVTDNTGNKGTGFSQASTLHRSEPDALKTEVLSAGFTLDGESSLLANPADDHSKHVGDNSLKNMPDRFIFRFKKPMSATGDKRPPASAMKNYYGNTYIYNLGEQLERRHFYYPDGRYQEFGQNSGTNLQEGYFYWDADGHNCQLHQYPADQRGLIVCHSFIARELNVPGMQDNGYDPPQGAHGTEIIPGYHALPH